MTQRLLNSRRRPSGLSRREALRRGVGLGVVAGLAPLGLGACARRDPVRGFDDYRQHDALALARLVRTEAVTPSDLLEIAIARADATNPRFKSVTVPLYNWARAQLAEGEPTGPFAGVPFLLKDLGIHLEGTRMTSGSRLFRDYVSDYSSALTKRYRRAGLTIFGRTHSPEFGASTTTETLLFGRTPNPWDLSRSVGGSSGGAAAAVALGIVPAAHASDGGGSIRIPASCCGLFGLKPSRGRISAGPRELDSNGGLSLMHVISRSVRDSAALLDVGRGNLKGDVYRQPRPERPFIAEVGRAPGKLRIGVLRDNALGLPVHDDCKTALAEAAALCRQLGHQVEDIYWPESVSGRLGVENMGMVMGMGSLRAVVAEGQRRGLDQEQIDALLEPINRIVQTQRRRRSALELSQARYAMAQLARAMQRHFAPYDAVLSPTMASIPPKLGVVHLDQDFESFSSVVLPYAIYTSFHNISGQPAMSVPLHWNADNLPVGVMFAAGRVGDEGLLLRLAAQLEEARPWAERRPPIANTG